MSKYFSDSDVNRKLSSLPKKHRLASSIWSVIVKYLCSKYTRLQVYSELPNHLWFSREKERSGIKISLPDTMNHFPFTAARMIQLNGEKQWKLFHETSFIHSIHSLYGALMWSPTGTCWNLNVHTCLHLWKTSHSLNIHSSQEYANCLEWPIKWGPHNAYQVLTMLSKC